jgi:carboxylesterase type B
MTTALVNHGAGDLVHRYRIEWRAKCVDKKYPKAWGATHTGDMAIWFFGNGEVLAEDEQSIASKAFLEPLSHFFKGERMDWGTEHGMQVRTLREDGSVSIEDDDMLEEGLKLWNALNKVGATGHVSISKL